MARFYPSNSVSSTGVTSDDVTITSLDVPESKTALTSDSDDKVIQGKLKEVTSTAEGNASIDSENSRVQLSVPTRGLYSTSAKLYSGFSRMAEVLGLTPNKVPQGESVLGVNGTYKGIGNATQADVRTGKTFSTSELSDAPGTMAEHSGGSYKPGTSNKVVVSRDRYLTGDVVVQGDPNLVASNIRKGVTIFGITGTAEGYYPGANDWYYKGVNVKGLTNPSDRFTKFTATRIEMTGSMSSSDFTIPTSTDTRNFTKLNIEGQFTLANTNMYGILITLTSPGGRNGDLGTKDYGFDVTSATLLELDISTVNEIPANSTLLIRYMNDKSLNYITRIWLS